MPDVNVLVYAHRIDTPHHAEAAGWLKRVASSEEPFALSEQVAAGFLRVVTNGKIFDAPTQPKTALAFVEQLQLRPNCRLVRPGPRHFPIFLRLCREQELKAGLVADAHHAALAIEHGCSWVSYDTDFARFAELRWILPRDA